MTIADLIRNALMKTKPGYGRVDTDESDRIVNRAAARGYLRGKGPFQHFMATLRTSNRRTTTRGKRAEQRQRANGDNTLTREAR